MRKYPTLITPALWALFVWDFIYFWVFVMFIYFLVGLCRRYASAPLVIFLYVIYNVQLCLFLNSCFSSSFNIVQSDDFPHRHNVSEYNNIILAPRRSAYEWMHTTPAVLPYGFHVSIIIKLCLNITWLFFFDREWVSETCFTMIKITIYCIFLISTVN